MKRATYSERGLRGAVCVAGVGLVCAVGCRRDVRLADKEVRTVEVGSVALYGLNLDESAAPEQVAYAALRAIREDFEATTPADRKAALDKQFDLCAADEIQRRNRTSTERDEWVHNVVYRWTPTVSHYVANFETEWADAEGRFDRRSMTPIEGSVDGVQECELAMQVSDPDGDPAASAVMLIWLAQDNGLWRVLHLGFDFSMRTLDVAASANRG